jgi:predicted PurR-regulated permease PerM
MDKVTLKKALLIAAIVLLVIFLSITYFFTLYRISNTDEVINKVFSTLRPIILGAVFAYIMKSTCNFYERRIARALLKTKKRDRDKVKRFSGIASLILTYITWFAMLTAILWIAIPQIIQSVSKFVNELIVKIPEYTSLAIEWEGKFLADNEMLRPYFDKALEWLINWSNTELIPWLQSLVSQILPLLLSFVTSIFDIVIGLVISFFILLGRKVLAKKSTLFLHCLFKDRTVNVILDEFKFADKMFSGFLEGKVIDSAIIGLIYYVVLEIMGVPYPALVAVICGVTNIIPIFGPFIGSIPSGLIILTADPIKVIPFVIFVIVIQFLDGYIIDPHIVGGNIKMSSFCVIFAVILFGGLWGFTGLLIGVPTFAVIYDIFRKLAIHLLNKKGKGELLEKYLPKPVIIEKKKHNPKKPVFSFLKKKISDKDNSEQTVITEKDTVNK